MDIIDVLLMLGILATFIVFGIAVWLIKNGKRKEQPTTQEEQPGGETKTSK